MYNCNNACRHYLWFIWEKREGIYQEDFQENWVVIESDEESCAILSYPLASEAFRS